MTLKVGRLRAVEPQQLASCFAMFAEGTVAEGADRLQLTARPERIALHLPCTQRNVVRSDAALRALLARVPALEVVVAPAHLAALERRTGQRVRLRKVATTVLEAPHAQCVEND